MDTTSPVHPGADTGGLLSLEQWLERNGPGALARLSRDTNIQYPQLWRYVKGRSVPKYPAASAISAATGGAVSVTSLVSRKLVKPKKRGKARRRA